MRIEIEIPKEFEEHFKQDRFEDTLHRLSADAHLLAGNYEQETAIMLIKAFKESKTTYNLEKVVEELEEKQGKWKAQLQENDTNFLDNEILKQYVKHYDMAIDIVKRGGLE
jgi:gas vesicle protein